MDALENQVKLAEETMSDLTEPKKKFRVNFRKLGRIGVVLMALVALGVIFGLLPALAIKSDIVALSQEAKGITEGIQAQNLNQSIEKLASTKKSLDKLTADYGKLSWLKVVPFANNYYKDGERVASGGRYLLEAGEVAIEALKPYSDLLGFGGGGDEAKKPQEMTTEQRLMLALDTLDKLGPSLNKVGEKLELASKETSQINLNRYPEILFGKKVRGNVADLIKMIDSTAKIAGEVKPIVSYLKPLLGFPGEKKYLLLFQNDAELRPTGGFLTAYAILSVNKGNFKSLGSSDIYSLDAKFGNRLPAPQPIKDYHKNVYNWHLRDMNLSPDFKVSMETFWENYKKVGSADIQGIIAVDTNVLVDLLRVLGPIGVADWGTFSAANDKRCNCPQVFYELERLADKPVGTLKTERKAMIGPLMHSILLNVMQSPRKRWPEFFNLVFSEIQEKHILFYFLDKDIQKAIEALNAGGRIQDYDADYLHVNDANFAGAKSNMFIKESFTQEIEVGSDGTITKTLIIDYKNPEPASNCNLEAGELCLNALYRDWVRIYVPKGSELLEASGSEIEVKTYEDLGKTVFEAFYGDKAPLRPQGKAQLTFKYKLPFKAVKGQPYKVLIQKQPGTYGYENIIKLNGHSEVFDLKTDRQFSL